MRNQSRVNQLLAWWIELGVIWQPSNVIIYWNFSFFSLFGLLVVCFNWINLLVLPSQSVTSKRSKYSIWHKYSRSSLIKIISLLLVLRFGQYTKGLIKIKEDMTFWNKYIKLDECVLANLKLNKHIIDYILFENDFTLARFLLTAFR